MQQILQTENDECSSSSAALVIEAAKSRISETHSGKAPNRRISGAHFGKVSTSSQCKEVSLESSDTKLKPGNIQFVPSEGSDVNSVDKKDCDNCVEARILSHGSSQPINASVLSNIVDNGSESEGIVKQLFESGKSIADNTGDYRCSDHGLVVVQQRSETDKILIVDNINNALEFSSSQRILKEIHNFFPSVKIDFAYSLAKGGVAIHTTCKEDRDLLLTQLPAESFGSGVKHTTKGRCDKVVFIKGVDTSVSECHILEKLREKGINVFETRRLTKRYTGRPTRVVKVKCSEHTAEQLLNTKLVVNNKTCAVEKERPVRVIRCFKCQSLGHLSRHCRNFARCERCAASHEVYERCVGGVKCINCGGNHPSSSSSCPEYLKRYEDLTKQYSEC